IDILLRISLRVFICLVGFAPFALHAQNSRLTLQSGSNLIVAGGNLVLSNTDLQAEGSFDASNATVLVRGSNNTFFGGTGVPVIQVLTINTSPASTLTLNNTVQISSVLDFQNGLIDLNNQQLQLTGNGVLQSESEAAHITGLSGGMVTASATGVSNPNQLNIGNLGASLTSSASLGNLSVSRSHKPATNPGNSSLHGIQRTYLIQPQNNTALNATLRFYYLDAELNGDDPATLSLWKSSDGVNWNQIGADTRNAVSKYVEKAGLADFSYWTLTDLVNPLPLTLISFKATCEGPYAILQWQTGSESDIDRFVVERSGDGSTWLDLGETTSYNNPNGSSYTYKDPAPQASSFYRLKILDRSGSVSYSPTFRGGFSDIALPFLVYPNPSPGHATAQVAVREATTATLQLYNMTGQLLYSTEWNLQPGANQYPLPVAGLAAGAYLVKLLLNGALLQTRLAKQ